MISQQLIDYVKNNLKKGFRVEQLKQSMISAGWPVNDIEGAISIATQETFTGPSPAPEPVKKEPKKKNVLRIIVPVILILIIIGTAIALYTVKGEEAFPFLKVFKAQDEGSEENILSNEPDETGTADDSRTAPSSSPETQPEPETTPQSTNGQVDSPK